MDLLKKTTDHPGLGENHGQEPVALLFSDFGIKNKTQLKSRNSEFGKKRSTEVS
jgi:hypothetical protein